MKSEPAESRALSTCRRGGVQEAVERACVMPLPRFPAEQSGWLDAEWSLKLPPAHLGLPHVSRNTSVRDLIAHSR